MPSFAVVDTSAIIAAANESDPDHSRCLRALGQPGWAYVYPVMVVAEACYMIDRDRGPGAEARFLRAIATLAIEPPRPAEWARMAELVEQYGDMRIGGTDASIVALAERLGAETIVTLNTRHFLAIRPLHCEAFRVVPE